MDPLGYRQEGMRLSGRLRLRGAAVSAAQADSGSRPEPLHVRGKARLIVTCEHGGKRVPRHYAPLFAGGAGVLASHRGFDAGALTLARELAGRLAAPLHYAIISRLLVDLNRSETHAEVHSTFTQALAAAHRAGIVQQFYTPYRSAVEDQVARWLAAGESVVHVSCHSFTPFLHGRLRRADVGFLFDAARRREAALCWQWRTALQRSCPGLRIRMNAPYDGASDGFTTTLRQRHGPLRYAGIEIEINQRLVHGKPVRWRRLRHALAAALAD